MLNFKPAFLLSSFIFIKRLFFCSKEEVSAVRVVSSAYLRLLIIFDIQIYHSLMFKVWYFIMKIEIMHMIQLSLCFPSSSFITSIFFSLSNLREWGIPHATQGQFLCSICFLSPLTQFHHFQDLSWSKSNTWFM